MLTLRGTHILHVVHVLELVEHVAIVGSPRPVDSPWQRGVEAVSRSTGTILTISAINYREIYHAQLECIVGILPQFSGISWSLLAPPSPFIWIFSDGTDTPLNHKGTCQGLKPSNRKSTSGSTDAPK